MPGLTQWITGTGVFGTISLLSDVAVISYVWKLAGVNRERRLSSCAVKLHRYDAIPGG